MKNIYGDLIKLADQGDFDLICHGCNCFLTMGAGIAKFIKQKWPQAYNADLNTEYGDKNKLGNITLTIVKNSINKDLIIINAYTQYAYGAGKNVDYDAIRKCFKLIKTYTNKTTKIGYPMIGAGLAGGDWNIISKIINEELQDRDHTLVIYEP